MFTDPDTFDVHRDEAELRQILSFGGGRHFCLGANLARLESKVALRSLVQRARTVEADHAGAVRFYSANVRGFAQPAGEGGGAMSKYEQPARRPAVVTGASSGIGAATALVLGAQGFPVALGARRTEKCEEVAAQIREAGGEAVVHPLDLTDDQSVSDFAKAVTADLGDVEVVVSNAGSVGPGTIHEIETERMRDELDVNLLGAHRLVRAFVPGMVERRRGDLVFVSSDVAVRPRPFMAAYAASKWGLEGLAQSMQMELEGTGVRASIVRPGPTWSEMGSTWDDQDAADVLNHWVRFGLARHPHFLKPEALANAIHTIVSAPRGVHLNLVEVTPEAPVEDR